MARIFISSADGIYESDSDVNYSDNGPRSRVNYMDILRHAAKLATVIIMVGSLIPMAGSGGVCIAKAIRTLFGRLI